LEYYIPDIRNAFKTSGYNGYLPRGINAQPSAVNQLGYDRDTIIRVTIPGSGEVVQVNGSAGEDDGHVRFYIFKDESEYDNPLWSAWDGGIFNLTIPYSAGDQLFFATDAGDDDINDWAYWSEIELLKFTGVLPALPVADFIADVTSGTAPLNVQFTDTSQTSPLSWNWNFGDGTTSDEQSPLHTYSSGGLKKVILTVTDKKGALLQHLFLLIYSNDNISFCNAVMQISSV
jgi:hypothetical protein